MQPRATGHRYQVRPRGTLGFGKNQDRGESGEAGGGGGEVQQPSSESRPGSSGGGTKEKQASGCGLYLLA